MIYFKEMYIIQAKEMIYKPFHQAEEIKEFIGIRKDLDRIAQAGQHLHSNSGREAARQLDLELREKYPIINQMLDIANGIPRKISSLCNSNSTRNSTREAAYLQQDYYGILCYFLMKNKVIGKVEECIDYVD